MVNKKQDTYNYIIDTIKSFGHKVIGPETHRYEDLINIEQAKKSRTRFRYTISLSEKPS